MNPLGSYLRHRARQKGMSVSDVCKSAGRSRQTFYALSETRERLPDLETLVDFAVALDVHPMRLVQLVFDEYQGVFCRRRSRNDPRDASQFVRDVTIPDGALVMAGARFVKTWEVQNAGDVAWEGRFLQCMDDDLVVFSAQHGAQLSVSPRLKPEMPRVRVPVTMPGETALISVAFRAPDLPGTCVSYWKSVDVSGAPCFPDAVGLSVQVRVVAMEHTSMRRRAMRAMRADVAALTPPKTPRSSRG